MNYNRKLKDFLMLRKARVLAAQHQNNSAPNSPFPFKNEWTFIFASNSKGLPFA